MLLGLATVLGLAFDSALLLFGLRVVGFACGLGFIGHYRAAGRD
jgi:hypothetical protein